MIYLFIKSKHKSGYQFFFCFRLQLFRLESFMHACPCHNVENPSQKNEDSCNPAHYIIVCSAAEVVENRGGHAN